MNQKSVQKILASCVLASLTVACSNTRFTGAQSASLGSTSAADPSNPGSGDPTGQDPTTPVPTPTPVGVHTVNYDQIVPAASNKVDFLLVVDNSTSMTADQQKLAAQMKGFADKLATLNIDWQMCVTTTSFITYSNGAQNWGYSIPWSGYSPASGTKYVLRASDAGANLNNIFVNTIAGIGVDENAGDERGIKSVYNHLINGAPGNNTANSGGCYRSGSAISVIILSDEDERSVGGDVSKVKTNLGESVGAPSYTYRALEDQDMPQNLLSMAKGLFGQNLRFSFNSIVVDSAACENIQDTTPWVNSAGQSVVSASHTGTKYIEMSNLTGGGISSICNSTFQDNLNLFTQKLTNTLKSITLECAPSPLSSLAVKVNGAAKAINTDYTVSGAVLSFNTAVTQGTRIEMSYQCQ